LYTLGIIEGLYDMLEEAGVESGSIVQYLDEQVEELETIMHMDGVEEVMLYMGLEKREVE
jgi:hypothetical protein